MVLANRNLWRMIWILNLESLLITIGYGTKFLKTHIHLMKDALFVGTKIGNNRCIFSFDNPDIKTNGFITCYKAANL